MRNPTSAFKFATLKFSSYEIFFKQDKNEVIRRMGKFMEPYNTDTTAEGVEKVRREWAYFAYISQFYPAGNLLHGAILIVQFWPWKGLT